MIGKQGDREAGGSGSKGSRTGQHPCIDVVPDQPTGSPISVTWQHLLVRMSCFPFHHHLFQHTHTNASSGNLQRAQHLFDGVYSLGGNYTSTLFNLHSNQ